MYRLLKLLAGAMVVSGVLAAPAMAASPSISGVSATSIKTTSAILKGRVNPHSSRTVYVFQWGLTTSYGSHSDGKTIAGGKKNEAVHITARNLLPGTVYHFRLVALNKVGGTLGTDHTFRTAGNPPPSAATGPASAIRTTSATVTGVVNPHGAATIWAVQYGLTGGYGVQTFPRTIPAGNAPVIVAQPMVGLAPGTTFHYRIVALHNGSVTQGGADASFMTLPNPRPVPHVRATTSPHRDAKAPFIFTTSGRVNGPSRIPASLGCTQSVTVRFLLGKRQVASDLAPVQPNCTFSVQTTLKHRPRGSHGEVHLREVVHFQGNGYLAPANARPRTVVLG